MPYWNDGIEKWRTDQLFASRALLLGRATYEEFVDSWPVRSGDPFTDRMNSLPKFVASTTLEGPLEWNKRDRRSVLLSRRGSPCGRVPFRAGRSFSFESASVGSPWRSVLYPPLVHYSAGSETSIVPPLGAVSVRFSVRLVLSLSSLKNRLRAAPTTAIRRRSRGL